MTIDFGTAILCDGDFTRSDNYSDLIENSDHITLDESWMNFTVEGLEDGLLVEFTQDFEGYWTHCPGDYWTPPDSDFELIKDELFINRVLLDDIEVEMTTELERLIMILVINEIENSNRRNSKIYIRV
jgi:hypothetical protein